MGRCSRPGHSRKAKYAIVGQALGLPQKCLATAAVARDYSSPPVSSSLPRVRHATHHKKRGTVLHARENSLELWFPVPLELGMKIYCGVRITNDLSKAVSHCF